MATTAHPIANWQSRAAPRGEQRALWLRNGPCESIAGSSEERDLLRGDSQQATSSAWPDAARFSHNSMFPASGPGQQELRLVLPPLSALLTSWISQSPHTLPPLRWLTDPKRPDSAVSSSQVGFSPQTRSVQSRLFIQLTDVSPKWHFGPPLLG